MVGKQDCVPWKKRTKQGVLYDSPISLPTGVQWTLVQRETAVEHWWFQGTEVTETRVCRTLGSSWKWWGRELKTGSFSETELQNSARRERSLLSLQMKTKLCMYRVVLQEDKNDQGTINQTISRDHVGLGTF